jgi:hypothetical protein
VNLYSRSHLTDQSLLRGLNEHLSHERNSTAEVLADLAEVEERKIYLAAAYPSMSAWCVSELHMSEDAAHRRLRAARVARQFPAIFSAVAEGRVHLSAVSVLAPRLTQENVDELLSLASNRSKTEIERLLAERYPRPDVLASIAPREAQAYPGIIQEPVPGRVRAQSSGGTIDIDRGFITPLSPGRFALQVTISGHAHELLLYAQQLMSHEVPSHKIEDALERVLEIAARELEKRKFGSTSRLSPVGHRKLDTRYIPLAVKRAVWERDQGQCTFTSECGKRCGARDRVEFDHVVEFSRGGQATVENLRLRCRAHNQYAAEMRFGAEFMKAKREAARRAAVDRQVAGREAAGRQVAETEAVGRAETPMEATKASLAANTSEDRDVMAGLRTLGFRADEASWAAKLCQSIPDASLEQRMKLALSYLVPPHRYVPPAA